MFVPPIYGDKILVDRGAQHTAGAPVICSEYGGVNIIPPKGTAAGERDWGYTTASDPEDLLKRLESLAMAVVRGGYTCGMVYTQLYVLPSPLIIAIFPVRRSYYIGTNMACMLCASDTMDRTNCRNRCDIEQEVNGLYSYDRKEKVPASRVKAIMDAAIKYYNDHIRSQGSIIYS